MTTPKQKKNKFETTKEIELAVVNFLDCRKHLIVPNVSWGMFSHELDLAVLSSKGYLTEIEIKVDRSDLIKNKNKKHFRGKFPEPRIKYLYFAMPQKFDPDFIFQHIPDTAGLIHVDNSGKCSIIRKGIAQRNCIKLTEKEKYQLARLGALRIWNLKKTLLNLTTETKEADDDVNQQRAASDFGFYP